MTVRALHRRLVETIAHRAGFTGSPLPNRPLQDRSRQLANPGPRLAAASARQAAVAHHPSRRRVLVRWQGRVESWLRGARP